jgi:hypothetical protein
VDPVKTTMGHVTPNLRFCIWCDLWVVVTSSFKAKPNAHSMCAKESSLHIYRIENRYRITNVTNI